MSDRQTTEPERNVDTAAANSEHKAGAAEADLCSFAQRISAYHDGELAKDESREVERHISGCAACFDQLAFFNRVTSRFNPAGMPRLNEEARERLLGLNEELQAERMRIKPKPSADVRWVRRLSAAAAVLFVVAAGKVVYDQHFTPRSSNPVIRAVSPADPGAARQQPVINTTTGQSTNP